MKDGEPFGGSTWISEPEDGVLCLVATRRTLDINGECCDYARCKATHENYHYRRIKRCMLLPDHEGPHTDDFRSYWD